MLRGVRLFVSLLAANFVGLHQKSVSFFGTVIQKKHTRLKITPFFPSHADAKI